MHPSRPLLALLLLSSLPARPFAQPDDYVVAPGRASLVVAMGCFWCGEESFERHAPGVLEAVSGYTGGSLPSPTYRAHDGHVEAVLVEYDPAATSYAALVRHALRSLDPLDGGGQFCDRGGSYAPAIFYSGAAERAAAEEALAEVAASRPEWDVRVPLRERVTFWTAEDYHQDYYVKNPGNYGYYKKVCGREARLKEVWGEEEYACYHDASYSCFGGTVENEGGADVAAVGNLKGTGEIEAAALPRWAAGTIGSAASVLAVAAVGFFACRKKKGEPVEAADS